MKETHTMTVERDGSGGMLRGETSVAVGTQ